MPVYTEDEAKKCAQYLLEKGMRRVIITLGERGCLSANADCMDVVPSFKVKSIDTTGAGDAFIGSFAVFLGEGMPEKEALRRTNLYAALSTTKIGTQKSFCTRGEFEKEWQNRGSRL
jgi:ribokinase